MRLLSYSDLPDWMQDNDCIVDGYRPQLRTWGQCLKSMFALHTETLNIWTHLIGAAIFMLLAVYVYAVNHDLMSAMDVFVFGLYFASIISCLLFSSMYHTFTCHSRELAQLCKRFDYCGISLLITGSFVSWTYYAFYSDPLSRTVYLTIVSLVGAAVAVVSLMEKFGSSEFRSCRAVTYLAFGISAGLPVIHYYFFAPDYVAISLSSMLSFAGHYIAGAVIYALRIPEKFFPGKFDIMFHSHQIFHVFVVVAAIIHLFNIEEIATARMRQQSIAGDVAGHSTTTAAASVLLRQ